MCEEVFTKCVATKKSWLAASLVSQNEHTAALCGKWHLVKNRKCNSSALDNGFVTAKWKDWRVGVLLYYSMANDIKITFQLEKHAGNLKQEAQLLQRYHATLGVT